MLSRRFHVGRNKSTATLCHLSNLKRRNNSLRNREVASVMPIADLATKPSTRLLGFYRFAHRAGKTRAIGADESQERLQ